MEKAKKRWSDQQGRSASHAGGIRIVKEVELEGKENTNGNKIGAFYGVLYRNCAL